MDYVAEHGLPHSAFKSWSPEDQSKTLAWLMESRTRCQMCGTADWEWDEAKGGTRFAYEPMEKICRGCYLKEVLSQESVTGQTPGKQVILVPSKSITFSDRERMLKRQREALDEELKAAGLR